MANKNVRIKFKLNNGNNLVIRPLTFDKHELVAVHKQIILNTDCIKQLNLVGRDKFEISSTYDKISDLFGNYYLINDGLILHIPASFRRILVSIGLVSHKYKSIYFTNTTNIKLFRNDLKLSEEECTKMIDIQLSENSEYINISSLIGLLKMNDVHKRLLITEGLDKKELIRYTHEFNVVQSINFDYYKDKLWEILI